MTRTTRRSLRIFAVAGILATFACAFFLTWYIAPARHVHSAAWVSTHSHEDLCREVGRSISRLGWGHDESLLMAECGDASWAARILDDPDLDHLLSGFDVHVGSALQGITNQPISNTDAPAWRAWWQANRQHSQAEWIRDGFRKGGLNIDPLSPHARLVLLESLAPSAEVPPGWRINAFRVLYASGFRPSRQLRVADLGSPPSDATLQGLLRYVGLLHSRYGPLPTPRFLTFQFNALMFAVLFLIAAGCVVILRFTREKGTKTAA